ncbi:MAG: hypothetical protein LBM96_06020 [Methanobrevibacter sp.]|nr:hypothetical protein [Candidatus Methanoflexus mossambicus]
MSDEKIYSIKKMITPIHSIIGIDTNEKLKVKLIDENIVEVHKIILDANIQGTFYVQVIDLPKVRRSIRQTSKILYKCDALRNGSESTFTCYISISSISYITINGDYTRTKYNLYMNDGVKLIVSPSTFKDITDYFSIQ